MAITFTKDANGKVIVDRNGTKLSLDASMNIIPAPNDENIIIVTDTSAPMEAREVLKFGWNEVVVPVATDRNDLIEQLGQDYFYLSFSASVVFPTNLAKEVKQDTQIALATDLNGYVDGLEALLTSLDGKDFATETTLNQIKGFVDSIESILSDIELNTTGLNLEATQLLIKGVLDNIKLKTDNLDVALSTRASEATLIQVRDYLDTVETKLQSIIDSLTSQNEASTTQSTTTVAASDVSVLLKAANSDRKQITITNEANKTLWICFFTPATSATPFALERGETWVFPRWKGAIYGIWDTAPTGNAYITEETT